jgi:hypothetical protein
MAGMWHFLPTPSSTEVKNELDLYLYTPTLRVTVCYRVTFTYSTFAACKLMDTNSKYESISVLEKLIVTQFVKKLKVNYHIHHSWSLDLILFQMNPSRVFPLDFLRKILCALLFTHCYMPCQSHPSCFVMSYLVKSTNYETTHYWVFTSLLLLFLSWVRTFSLAPSSQTSYVCNICSSLNMRAKVSHPYKIT